MALCVISGVAVGLGWQGTVAVINMGSYYLVGAPLAVLLGWFLSFGIMVRVASKFCQLSGGTIFSNVDFITAKEREFLSFCSGMCC